MTPDATWPELLKFIAEVTCNDVTTLNENTRIEDDLGVTGNEGFDLIKKFSVRFNVEITSFTFEKYFYPEPGMFGVGNWEKVQPLTLADLMNAIDIGRLDDSLIGSKNGS